MAKNLLLPSRPLNAADTRVVVKFIVAATGYRRLDAGRNLFKKVPADLRNTLFLIARAWGS